MSNQVSFPNFSNAKVCVVGDVMLDSYWSGATDRISPEAPVPVVHVNQKEHRLGGAANVALNLKSLGVHVTLFGIIGRDKAGEDFTRLANEHGLDHRLIQQDTQTIVKLRVLGRAQQLIRCDFEKSMAPFSDTLVQAFEKDIANYDVVVFSDYAKGTLAQSQAMIAMAKKHNIPVVVDPKSKDFGIYRGATILTPNQKEFDGAMASNEQDMGAKAHSLIDEHEFGALLVTQGAQGMTLFEPKRTPWSIPTQAKDVYDITGAGDTVIAVLSACLACQMSFAQAAQFANAGAGVVVGKLGTSTVSCQELEQVMTNKPKKQQSLMSVIEQVKQAQQQGQKVVFTNGCFDILHAGHVTYLQQAAAKGDKMIVAVNSDASVSRLKGPTRPINPLSSRMTVLSGLGSIDWLVEFGEDTPLDVIKAIKPDVLIKGADYQIDDIVGAKEVLSWGGQVLTIDLVEGHSTTSTLEKMKQTKENVGEVT